MNSHSQEQEALTSPQMSELDLSPYIDAVQEELISILNSYSGDLPATLIQIGKSALSAPHKVMARLLAKSRHEEEANSGIPIWPLYVILSYQAAQEPQQRGNWREAVAAAAAVEIAIAATDLLDELTDADPSPIIAEFGPGQALNTANLMLVIAQQTLLGRGQAQGSERNLAALEALLDMGLQASVGQHLDMLYERMAPDEVTPEMSVGMTEKKAGALIGGACRIGGLVAGAPTEVVDLLQQFGKELGGIAQLINDVQDVTPRENTSVEDGAASPTKLPPRKTDLRMRKRTLPIVFTLRDESPQPNAVQRAFNNPRSELIDEEELRRTVLDVGGIQFAQLIMEVHRQNAFQILDSLERLRAGARDLLLPMLPGI
ncbi:MAG: polyprenyl synthetase family protein [Chloroflexi bacterium]|nr:polyprenyl synthetase family protein [Chloroflexota bacterium]